MATEVKYLSDTLRMIRNCEISPQRAREEVGFLINLIRAVIAEHEAERSKPAPLKRPNRTGPSPEVLAHVETEPPFVVEPQPAPAPAGDMPEWCYSALDMVLRQEISENVSVDQRRRNRAKIIRDAAESEIARRVAEATKERDAETQKSRRLALEWGDKLTQRDAEIERLKAQLAKWESEPVGKMITELRDEERESKNADIKKLRSKIDELLNENAAQVEENDRLKAELAATTKPVELGSANIREIDGMKMIYLGDAQAAVRCERAARLTQRDAEIERLKAELAEARKPIPAGEPLATVEDFQSFLQRERAARLAAEKEVKKWQSDAYQLGVEKANLESQLSAAEQRLALTREAWRHRVVNTGKHHFRRYDVLTDADIDAAIAAHEKSKADAAGGGE